MNEKDSIAAPQADAAEGQPQWRQTDKQIIESVDNIRKALATYYRLRRNNEPSHDAVKSIDHTIFNEEMVLNAIAERLKASPHSEPVAWTMDDYEWACLNEAMPKHSYPAYIDAQTKSVWESNPGASRGGTYGGDAEMASRYTVPLYAAPPPAEPAREAVAWKEDIKRMQKEHGAAELSSVTFLKALKKTMPHTEAVADCSHCQLNYLISRFIEYSRTLSALAVAPALSVDALVEKLRELAGKWKEQRDKFGISRGSAQEAADELEALVAEYEKGEGK